MVLSTIEVCQRLLAERIQRIARDGDDPHASTAVGAAHLAGFFGDWLRRVTAGQPIHPTEKQCHPPADFVESNLPLAAPHPAVVTHLGEATR